MTERQLCAPKVPARFVIATLVIGAVTAAGGAQVRAAPHVGLHFVRPNAARRFAKLDSRLLAIASSSGTASGLAAAVTQRVDVSARGLLVVIEPSQSVPAAEMAVEAVGGSVDGEADGLVEARVPSADLADLAQSPSVRRVRAPALHIPESITGEGVATINAPAWHAAGFTGSGVKIGIVDVGFAGYLALLGTELPASVTTKDLCSGGLATDDDHGTAVAEIIHEVAPGAQLF